MLFRIKKKQTDTLEGLKDYAMETKSIFLSKTGVIAQELHIPCVPFV